LPGVLFNIAGYDRKAYCIKLKLCFRVDHVNAGTFPPHPAREEPEQNRNKDLLKLKGGVRCRNAHSRRSINRVRFPSEYGGAILTYAFEWTKKVTDERYNSRQGDDHDHEDHGYSGRHNASSFSGNTVFFMKWRRSGK
jgi:hypothetical protein